MQCAGVHIMYPHGSTRYGFVWGLSFIRFGTKVHGSARTAGFPVISLPKDDPEA